MIILKVQGRNWITTLILYSNLSALLKPTNLGFSSEGKRNREFCFSGFFRIFLGDSGFFRMGLGILRLGLWLVQVGPAAHLTKSQTHTTNWRTRSIPETAHESITKHHGHGLPRRRGWRRRRGGSRDHRHIILRRRPWSILTSSPAGLHLWPRALRPAPIPNRRRSRWPAQASERSLIST